MALIKSISVVSGLTLVSRFFGFFRDVLLARFLGVSLAADCFFVAFKLPNFFRRLFAEGAFSAAFVPIFCGILGPGDSDIQKAAARGFAEATLALLLPFLLIFTALMQTFMPWTLIVIAPGFIDEPGKYDLAVEFTRATFPYLMLISLVSLLSGVLSGLNRFSAAAAAPVLLNLTLILSLIFFHETQIMTGRALSRAVTIAGVIQLFWLIIAVSRSGMPLRLSWPRITPQMKELFRVMLPAIVGAGAIQINLVIDIILASFLPEGSLSYLFYADRLNQLPIGVIGVAVGTVLLPTLSRMLAGGELGKANNAQNRAVETALLLTLPAALALIIIPMPLISVLFERGAFTAAATNNTAMALMAYAAGLPAYVLIKVLVPGFYARKDTLTPMKIGIATVVINTVLNIILMIPLQHVGLALATAISAWVNAGLLFFYLWRRGHFQLDSRLKQRILRIVISSAFMGALLAWGAGFADPWFKGDLVTKIAAILFLVLGGIISYGLAAIITGAVKGSEVAGVMKRERK